MKKPFVIGISGSIGSGKSLVRHLLAMRGVLTIDADELTHSLLAKGKAGHIVAVQMFGRKILGKDGEVNRGALGEIVFKDPLALKKLEEHLHPLVNECLQNILKYTDCPIVAVEAIKLYDSELIHAVDSRWFVTSTADSQVERLKKNRRMTHTEITDRLRAQSFPKRMDIDFFIENSGQIKDTWVQVDAAWQKMMQTISEFSTACDQIPKEFVDSICDLPAIEAIEQKEMQRINKIVWNDPNEMQAENILKSLAFLLPVEQDDTHIVWKFTHFNARVEGISRKSDDALFISGLNKLEKLTHFWGGNCIIIRLVKKATLLEQKLLEMRYEPLSQQENWSFPFLILDPLITDGTGTYYIKSMPNSIWRLIP